MDNSERIANAKKWSRSVRIRAAFRLSGWILLTGLLSAFITLCLYDSITQSREPLLGLLIMALFSPVFFLLYYCLHKKIDEEIEAVRGTADELMTVRFAAVADPNAFVEEMKQEAVVYSRKTLLTPEMIMTYGMFQSCLPLNCITAISIEPHPEKNAYLLVHAHAGEEHRRYVFECPECFGTEHFLRDQAARITEAFRVNAPQCQITSPYIEQLPPPGTAQRLF